MFPPSAPWPPLSLLHPLLASTLFTSPSLVRSLKASDVLQLLLFWGKDGGFFSSLSTFRFGSIFSYSWLRVAFTSSDLLHFPLSESISSVAGNISARYPDSPLPCRVPGLVLQPQQHPCRTLRVGTVHTQPFSDRQFSAGSYRAEDLSPQSSPTCWFPSSSHIFLHHPSLISPGSTPQDLAGEERCHKPWHPDRRRS